MTSERRPTPAVITTLAGRSPAASRSWFCLPAVLALATAACVPGERTAERVLERFVTAVQAEDLDELYCLLAGASQPEGPDADPAKQRADFDAWARSRYAAYLTGRDHGGQEFADDGVVLVKTFALGKGTFYSMERVSHPSRGRLDVDTAVRFGYGQIDYSALSPGTTFYLAARPPGRIVAVKVPYSPEQVSEEVLESTQVRWELARVAATSACPAGWAIVSVVPVAGTETSTQITWLF